MSAHIANEIPRLLTGEARRDDVLAAAAHLRTCVDCQHELISAVVAHASLTSARRFAPEIVSGLSPDLFPTPDESDDALGDEPDEAEAAAHADDPAHADAREADDVLEDDGSPGAARPHPPLPDLSAVFAQVRREAAAPHRRGRRRPPVRYLAAAAAAVVVVGGGTAIYLAASGGNSSGGSRTIKLAAFDKGTSAATATISGGDAEEKVRIDAAGLPQVPGTRYEVWLTDSGRTAMQPVGWLGTNGAAAMTVPTDLLDRFSDIEVSVQKVNATSYDYSGTSVLRGGYA